jgi:hypothetical protein
MHTQGISRSPPAVLTQFEEAEQIYIVVTYRGRAWTIYGNFVIRPVQGFASLLSTATFRVKGQDKNGFTAALIFHRSAAFKSTAPGYQKFTLREIQVYIPEGNNGAEAGSENFPSGIAEPKAAPSGGAAAGVLSKIDAEVLEDVVALIDVLQDEKSSLSNEFIGAQAMGETKEIQGELSELTRIVNVLIEHADTLRAEEIGEKALVNISPVVFEAIRQGEEHIAANAFSQGFESARKRARDRREVNKEAKTLVHMRDQELADYFVRHPDSLFFSWFDQFLPAEAGRAKRRVVKDKRRRGHSRPDARSARVARDPQAQVHCPPSCCARADRSLQEA